MCWRPMRSVCIISLVLFNKIYEYAVKTYSNVVDPDQVTVVQGDTVTTPDVLGVDISDGDVSVAVSYKGTGLKRRKEPKLTE